MAHYVEVHGNKLSRMVQSSFLSKSTMAMWAKLDTTPVVDMKQVKQEPVDAYVHDEIL